MAKKMLIDATHPEETRVVVVDGNKVEEFDFESENKRQLAGNIYLAKVTRVEPSLQAAFVDYGGNRHGFLAFSEIHPDYYQIPVADRQALLAEERAYALAQEEEEDRHSSGRSSAGRASGGSSRSSGSRGRSSRSRSASRTSAAGADQGDAVVSAEASIPGMDVVDLGEDETDLEGTSPAFTVAETPVDTPAAGENGGNGDDHADHDHDGDDEADHARPNRDDAESEIESVGEEDVAEEISQPRKPRPRKYKIQEVVKVRQIMLVQVVKEERGNKGAALTTYLSLAGRYCVLMPNTARGGGISRKITNAADRKKLKEIAGEIEVPDGAGLIIRTAGAQRTKAEIKRDYEYLQRMWEQIRELTLKSIAPAKIYEEGDLIKRSIRDLYNKDIDEVFVEGEAGYRSARDFMKMIMPSHAKNVKLYAEQMPLFARFQVESYLSSMFNPTVQLKSGGYIVIGVTEALVAIDVNSGRATKEGSIEETALKTNIEAAEEVARQLRLRDLAGLIVIDFIDMEERKNNAAVEKRFKDKLKTDRARIQVGRISGFGLLEMSRQRLRPGMLEATTAPCHHCHGTGLVRSDDSLSLTILRQLEEEGTRKRSKEVLLKAPVAIVNFLMNQKREHVAGIEARYGMSVRIEADPTLVSPDFSIEKFKTATRAVPEALPVVSGNAALMGDLVEEDEDLPEETEDDEDEAAAEVAETRAAPRGEDGESSGEGNGDGQSGKKKRRRRRRRKSGSSNGNGANGSTTGSQGDDVGDGEEAGEDEDVGTEAAERVAAEAVAPAAEVSAEAAPAATPEADGAAKGRTVSRSRSRSTRAKTAAAGAPVAEASDAAAEPAADPSEKTPAPKKAAARKRTKAKPEAVPAVDDASSGEAEKAAPAEETPARKPATRKPSSKAKAAPKADTETSEPMSAPEPEPVAAEAEAEADASPKPKKRGWWSLGRG
jgi:ribonuclease E